MMVLSAEYLNMIVLSAEHLNMMVLSAEHLNIIMLLLNTCTLWHVLALSATFPTTRSFTSGQSDNVFFMDPSEGQFFVRDVTKCRTQKIMSVKYVCPPVGRRPPAVPFSGGTSWPPPRNPCISRGHVAGPPLMELFVNVNWRRLKHRTGNTKIWKE
jgi:hypothetical protein